jgi:hypothetical protein
VPAAKSNLDAGVGQHVRSPTVQESSNDRRHTSPAICQSGS